MTKLEPTRRLGSSDLYVTPVCLGTMTWGLQNTEAEAHAQLDYAISRGINFIDTAEVYPVPIFHPDSIPGTTEKYIGTYLAKHPTSFRERLVIATKIVGYQPSSKPAANRNPDIPLSEHGTTDRPYPTACLDRDNIIAGCNASLRRLQTSYIDLYQIHWPDRQVPRFGDRGYSYPVTDEGGRKPIAIRDTLLALKELLDEGKIKAYGLSNETSFGLCQYVQEADKLGMPRPASIQNQFSLLDRSFECELAECCAPRNHNVALLPWSVLAGGALTGKYSSWLKDNDNNEFNGDVKTPVLSDDARFVRFGNYMERFHTQNSLSTASKYERVAHDSGMTATQLALAFAMSRFYVTSVLVGATSVEQLKENIDACETVTLDADTLAKIDAVHNENKDVAVTFKA